MLRTKKSDPKNQSVIPKRIWLSDNEAILQKKEQKYITFFLEHYRAFAGNFSNSRTVLSRGNLGLIAISNSSIFHEKQ